MDDPVTIDVRGLKCPLPVLKAAKRMSAHPSGTRFQIIATDPLAAIDVPHFCSEHGHRLLASSRDGDELRFEIEKR
jgi:tRNA 2-thiouridine synthesizing protein A